MKTTIDQIVEHYAHDITQARRVMSNSIKRRIANTAENLLYLIDDLEREGKTVNSLYLVYALLGKLNDEH